MNLKSRLKLILFFTLTTLVTTFVVLTFVASKYPPLLTYLHRHSTILFFELSIIIFLIIILCATVASFLYQSCSTTINKFTNDLQKLLDQNIKLSDQYGEDTDFYDLANILDRKTSELLDNNYELETIKKRLEKEIYKKNLDLKISMEKEEKATSTKNEFLSNISHELRTPMNGIVGTIALLEDTTLDKRQTEYIEAINSSIKSLLKIIKDSLDMSKIESGTIKIEATAFSLKLLIEETISNQMFIKSPNVKFKFNWEDDNDGYVVSDPWILDQIINNLLNNAFKFTTDGEVRLNVKNMGKKGDKVGYLISVEDTGIGIEEQNQESIFKKFSQIDNSTFRETDGPGLGLAIASSLATALGFKINVESSLSEGSKFWFTIFLTKADPSIATNLKLKEDAHVNITIDLEGKKALVVEDNKINAMVIEDLLEKYGLNITVAYNGIEALEDFVKHKFDVVFMDCRMPKMDGYETTTEIRKIEREKGLKQTPIIALTANALKEDRLRCFDAGMNYYIEKPISKKTLAETLEECFENLED